MQQHHSGPFWFPAAAQTLVAWGTGLALVAMARRRILLANAYFAPERPLRRALCRAARRGGALLTIFFFILGGGNSWGRRTAVCLRILVADSCPRAFPARSTRVWVVE